MSAVHRFLVLVTDQGAALPTWSTRPPVPLSFGELRALLQPRPDASAATPRSDVAALIDDVGFADPHQAAPTPEATTAPVPDAAKVTAPNPLIVRTGPDGFEYVDDEGRVALVMTPAELLLLSDLATPIDVPGLVEAHRRRLGADALSPEAVSGLVGRALAAGLARVLSDTEASEPAETATTADFRRALGIVANIRARAKQRADQVYADPAADLPIQLVAANPYLSTLPLSIGMICSYAKAQASDLLRSRIDLLPHWIDETAGADLHLSRPAIYLFSNYRWCHAQNLEISRYVKERSPGSITIHGGPDTPQYDAEAEEYLRDNPHVDVVVRGEGEVTFHELLEAIAATWDGGPLDLDRLSTVPGLHFLTPSGLCKTDDRERIADIDVIPSPFLDGTLAAYFERPGMTTVLETNRGCPYGCTFCDWGSATRSRIRKFDMQRVLDELEYCAEHGTHTIFLADANFGIFERDVEIAEKVAELKATTGSPQVFITNYAKNTVKHLEHIVKILSDAGVINTGILSLQSMDEGVLKTIRRKNIKTEKYEELAVEFRSAGLPLAVDLMVGLPGSTIESFTNDLQQCVDREILARLPITTVLPNSPMNDPAYIEEHQIRTRPSVIGPAPTEPAEASPAARWTEPRFISSTSTFDEDDYEFMLWMRRCYLALESYGVLRHISRFLRQERNIDEMDLISRLLTVPEADRHRWPYLMAAVRVLPFHMCPPVSWALLIEDLRNFVVEVLGVPDDSALETVLRVQHALLPAADRDDVTIQLPHDYAAWHAAMIAAKEAGHLRDWPRVVPRLSEFGPAALEVKGSRRVAELVRGFSVDAQLHNLTWELDSRVKQPSL
jgi:radical SAM superfamily enzyme YgiQ (UPF0313 family)